MWLIQKPGTVSKISLIFNRKFNIRTLYVSNPVLADAETLPKADAEKVYDVLDELIATELTEEEILKERLKSRLLERIYRKFVKKESVPIETEYDFYMNRLQLYYARFGKESKLNPGIGWPTRQELQDTLEFEK